jgi:hypothetical protein
MSLLMCIMRFVLAHARGVYCELWTGSFLIFSFLTKIGGWMPGQGQDEPGQGQALSLLYTVLQLLKESAQALLIVMRRGSLRAAEEITGHKYETIGE